MPRRRTTARRYTLLQSRQDSGTLNRRLPDASRTAWEGHPTPQKKSSKFWPPGTCLCQSICVYLYKLRRSCARATEGVIFSNLVVMSLESSMDVTDKYCAHDAKDLSNKEETTRNGRAGPVSRKRLLYRFASRKAFPGRGLCAGWKLKRERESCESSSGFGGYQLCQLRP